MRERRRRELFGLAGYNLLAMVRRGFFYTFLTVYLREVLRLPVSVIALIGAANAVASTLGQVLLWGHVSDRTDRRAGLMVRGEAIAGVGYLVTFAAYRVTLGRVPPEATAAIVIVCLSTIEFFWSMTDVGFRAAIAQVTDQGNRGRYLGALDLLGLGGMGAGLGLAGILYRGGRGFENGALWLLAAGFILSGVPLIRATLLHLDGAEPSAALVRLRGPVAPAFRRFLWALAVAVIGSCSFVQIHSFFVRLPDTAGASDTGLATIRLVFWVVGGVAAPLVGVLVDRAGAQRVLCASMALLAVVPLAFIPTRSVGYAALSLGLFGAVFAGLRTAGYARAAELTPAGSRGRHFALYNAVSSLGWGAAALLLGGPVSDVVQGATGSVRQGYDASFVAGGAVTLVGCLLYVRSERLGRHANARAAPVESSPS